jgi:hypothetical protein
MVCPDRELVESLFVPRYLRDADAASAKPDSPFSATQFLTFRPRSVDVRAQGYSAGITTPKGISSFYFGSGALRFGKWVHSMTLKERMEWPASRVEFVTHHGMLTTFRIDDANEILRMVNYVETDGRQSNWVAWSIEDANGAYRGTLPETDPWPQTLFVRPVFDSVCVSFACHPNLVDSVGANRFSLIPAPLETDSVARSDFNEEWSILGVHRARSAIWMLWLYRRSTACRESFLLEPVDTTSMPEAVNGRFYHPPWKLIVFPEAAPADLVRALGALQQIPAGELPTAETVQLALRDKFDALIRIRDSYCLQANMDQRRNLWATPHFFTMDDAWKALLGLEATSPVLGKAVELAMEDVIGHSPGGWWPTFSTGPFDVDLVSRTFSASLKSGEVSIHVKGKFLLEDDGDWRAEIVEWGPAD